MTSEQGLTALAALVGASALLLVWMQSSMRRKLRMLSAVLAAYRRGDFSIRARIAGAGGLFDDVLGELNGLGGELREQRLSTIESWLLLRRVLSELDVVVLAFDEAGHVRLCNEAASRALGQPAPSLLGRSASELGIVELLSGEAPRVVADCACLGGGARDLRRSRFRLEGTPHVLVAVTDLDGALRTNEREAWKRLIAVFGHEINNSLAPIQSISESLIRTLSERTKEHAWTQDVADGLGVIHRRASALGRFTAAYRQLSRLPAPRLRNVDVEVCVRRAAELEQRLPIEIAGGPSVSIRADPDQVEHLLINLLKNAVDAALERAGGVRVRWSAAGANLDLTIEDDGPGLPDTANLFVPFFTTKRDGSGVGLALARQIADAHGGSLRLETRTDSSGARAVLELPLAPP